MQVTIYHVQNQYHYSCSVCSYSPVIGSHHETQNFTVYTFLDFQASFPTIASFPQILVSMYHLLTLKFTTWFYLLINQFVIALRNNTLYFVHSLLNPLQNFFILHTWWKFPNLWHLPVIRIIDFSCKRSFSTFLFQYLEVHRKI